MKKRFLWLHLATLLLLSLPMTVASRSNQTCWCLFSDNPEPKNVMVQSIESNKGFEPARKGMRINKSARLRVTAPAAATLICDNEQGPLKTETLDGRNAFPTVPCSLAVGQ